MSELTVVQIVFVLRLIIILVIDNVPFNNETVMIWFYQSRDFDVT